MSPLPFDENTGEFFNPIDERKITHTPSTLPYAHTSGSAVIKPIDKGRVKGVAVEAMRQQTNMQLEQIRRQMELLAEQARRIQRRIEVSEMIYAADLGFRPVMGQTYYLYERPDGSHALSMIASDEWGRKGSPFKSYIAAATLLADHTWDIQD